MCAHFHYIIFFFSFASFDFIKHFQLHRVRRWTDATGNERRISRSKYIFAADNI